MSEETPLSERILDATETVLRRHGVEKTNVVDIARVLEMSHGNIYRHFPSKKAILDAVAARWLQAVTIPLDKIVANRSRSAAERLEAWFDTLRLAKRRKVLDDPELFHVYHGIVKNMREVIADHVATLAGQVETIIADGIGSGEFSAELEPKAAARAFFQASAAFHHPALILQEPPTDQEARVLFGLLLAGMRG